MTSTIIAAVAIIAGYVIYTYVISPHTQEEQSATIQLPYSHNTPNDPQSQQQPQSSVNPQQSYNNMMGAK